MLFSQNQQLTAPQVMKTTHDQVDVSQHCQCEFLKTSETDQVADKRRDSVFLREGSRVGLLHLYDL